MTIYGVTKQSNFISIWFLKVKKCFWLRSFSMVLWQNTIIIAIGKYFSYDIFIIKYRRVSMLLLGSSPFLSWVFQSFICCWYAIHPSEFLHKLLLFSTLSIEKYLNFTRCYLFSGLGAIKKHIFYELSFRRYLRTPNASKRLCDLS